MPHSLNNLSFKDIHDYGIVGNLETCALVGIDGSVDWLCFPYLESPSIFAAILDSKKGGNFAIFPRIAYNCAQTYIDETNILQTTFYTALGTVVITDFMPVKEVAMACSYPVSSFLRKVSCLKGEVPLAVIFKPRFNYAQNPPELRSLPEGIVGQFMQEEILLKTPITLSIGSKCNKELEETSYQEYWDDYPIAFAHFNLKESEKLWFSLNYTMKTEGIKEEVKEKVNKKMHLEELLDKTAQYWQNWAHNCRKSISISDNTWHNLLVRSGLTLKLLTDPESGAIAAAATTSLPEQIGGVRNWDYRYAWIRDASFTIQALYHLGHDQEVSDYRRWIMKIIHQNKDLSTIDIMYGIHFEKDLKEEILSNLGGYKGSTPVRIGNGAVKQKQLDIFGELVNVIYETSRYGQEILPESWEIIREVVNYVCQVWNTKDSGIWEVRGNLRHFVYSKVMCWCALDRGIRIANTKQLSAPIDDWIQAREQIKDTILSRGFNPKLNSFRQALDEDALDSSNLLIPTLGFLPAKDPRVQGTIDATIKYLNAGNGLFYRYVSDDGLAGNEGCFLLCSFWLIKALALSSRFKEAEYFYSQILKYLGPLGLLSEEVDPKTGMALGNFPQAFSHIGLINAALYLGITQNQQHKGPRPIGITEQEEYF